MKTTFILFLMTFLLSTMGWGQEVVFEGRIDDRDNGGDLSDVNVVAIANGQEVYSTTTNRRGKYTVQIPTGKDYVIRYEKSGYVTKTMHVDVTDVIDEELPIGGQIMPPVDISLFETRENVDFSFMEEEPVVDWAYDKRSYKMDWDRKVYNKMKKRIEDKLAKAEELKQEKEAEYNALIQEADKLFKNEKYEEALGKYEEALQVPGKAAEEHPNNRLIEIEELLQQKAEEELAEKQANQQYYDLIEKADQLAKDKAYDDAIAKYEQAINLKDDEQYPKDQIALMKKEKEALAAREEYESLIADADDLFSKEEWDQALNKYKEAKALIDNEDYPRDQIKIIEDKLAEQAEQEALQEQFDDLVKKGDDRLAAEEFKEAIARYDEALELKSDTKVQEKRDEAQQELEAQQEKETINEKVNSLLADAETAMQEKNFETAVTKFDEVLSLDDTNTDAIEGKANALEAIEKEKKAAEQQSEFDDLVAKADKSFDNGEWKLAKDQYESAQELIGDNNHVNQRLNEIENKLKALNEKEAIAEQIETLKKQAADHESKDQWESAIAKYEEALELDEENQEIKDLLTAAQDSFDQWKSEQSEQEAFEKLKQEGETLLAQEKWEDARSKFEQALEIQDDAEIEANLEKIKAALADQQNQKQLEESFNTLIEEAEQLESEDELEAALDKYEEALALKGDADAENAKKALLDRIEKRKAAKEQEKAYNDAVAEAEELLNSGDYSGALKRADDALLVRPNGSEAQDLKNQAQDQLNALEGEEERYNNLLSNAKTAFDGNQLLEAKKLYEKAQEMRPKASLPQNKIVEIDELLRQQAEEEAKDSQKEERYQEKLDLAEVSAQNFKYAAAIDHLKDAANIKPNEDFPKKKIKEYQALLNKIEEQDAKEKKYNDLISNADQAFGNKEYESSIEFYNKALEVKSKEDYPKRQIAKAKEALETSQRNDNNKAYNDIIERADEAFQNNSYEKALEEYQSAVGMIEDDTYAQDKVNETQQIIKDLEAKEKEQSAEQKALAEQIEKADEQFERENYIEAKEAYEAALEIDPNDAYAARKVQESIEMAKSKVERGNDKRYQKIVDKADEYFDEENYEKAVSLYERALSLRSTDQYPKDQLAQIKAIQNGTATKDRGLKDLGEKQNITIAEGAALLEKAVKQKESLKQERVQQRIRKNENEAANRAGVDAEQRSMYNNEIEQIRVRRTALGREESGKKLETVNRLDDMQRELEDLTRKESQFELKERQQQNQELTYISDDFSDYKRSRTEDHQSNIDEVKKLENEYSDRTRAERAKDETNLLANNERLTEQADEVRQDASRATKMRKENERKIDRLQEVEENRTFEASRSEYEKIQKTKSDALLAELKKKESSKEKQVIQEQLKEDIAALEGNIQRKRQQETRETYNENIKSDALMTRAQEQYKSSKEGNDDQRQQAVEQIKVLEEGEEAAERNRGNKEREENRAVKDYTNTIEERKKAAARDKKDELIENRENVKRTAEQFERTTQVKNDADRATRQSTTEDIERTRIKEELSRKEKGESVKENEEKIKGIEASIDAGEEIRKKRLKEEKLATQDYLDKLEQKKVVFNEKIANSLAEEFPEGVSQEQYVRKDSDSIPYKIVTRRIVVKGDYGDVYMRIQTRNGSVTYSKNGNPVTEMTWLKGTENAKLERHFED